ncbi:MULTISPECIES: glycosyltransferase [unclassified Novosphingobium]|uniref:glycosyltransferase n=1 Tax=unclassified Novosphingobium TaxID=2644732 RepID=UPI0015CDF195|nr:MULTISPECIES: glycosyltransferase [unclassified Novosphingobium]NMN03965.1 glycosyltransferase involved in cell wall biosynthesis [Novosphingobium sp. SG919]NMN86045.1 glycosyltransferase involved in cell wall biosynthesis [Novosphingobium sp. SG916]
MTLRLLSLSTLYPASIRPGFGRFVARQMEALAARPDWEVTVINPIGLPPLPGLLLPRSYAQLRTIPPMERRSGVPVYHPRFPLVPALSGRFNPALIARAVLPLVRRLHAEQPFDMVDAQFFYPDGPAAARIARALGLPFAIKARGSDIHVWGKRPAALRQMASAAQGAGALLSVSQALADDMADLGLPEDKITVHYTGLDRGRFHPRPRAAARAILTERFHLPPAGPLVACVGALIGIKGQALAIRALAEPGMEGIALALAGTGPDEAALRALTRQLDVAHRVYFLGGLGHDFIPVLMAGASAVVLPSEREGLANVWIEALACGTPLVIPDIGGAREVVTAPAAGRIAAREPAAIARALAALIAQPSAPEAVAACAARFSWETNAAALAGVYEKVVRGG